MSNDEKMRFEQVKEQIDANRTSAGRRIIVSGGRNHGKMEAFRRACEELKSDARVDMASGPDRTMEVRGVIDRDGELKVGSVSPVPREYDPPELHKITARELVQGVMDKKPRERTALEDEIASNFYATDVDLLSDEKIVQILKKVKAFGQPAAVSMGCTPTGSVSLHEVRTEKNMSEQERAEFYEFSDSFIRRFEKDYANERPGAPLDASDGAENDERTLQEHITYLLTRTRGEKASDREAWRTDAKPGGKFDVFGLFDQKKHATLRMIRYIGEFRNMLGRVGEVVMSTHDLLDHLEEDGMTVDNVRRIRELRETLESKFRICTDFIGK